MSAAPAPVTLAAPLACPSCGHKVTGHWTGNRKTADQKCRTCGCVFEATWPGFGPVEPEIVVRPPGQEPGDEAG